MRKKNNFIIVLGIVSILLLLMLFSNFRNNLHRQLQGPIEGTDSIVTIENNLSIISKSNHAYTWDWSNLKKWPIVAKPNTDFVQPLNQSKIVYPTKSELVLTDLKAEKEISSLPLPYDYEVKKISVSPAAKAGVILLSQKDDYKIATFDSDFKNLPIVLEKNADEENCTIFDVAVNDEGNLICIVGKRGKGWIFVKDIKNDKIIMEKTFDEYGQFTIVKFSPDNKSIYVAEKIRFILCMDSATGNILRTYEMPVYNTPANQKQNISCLAISPDNKILAVDTEPARRICFWDIASGKEIGQIYASDLTVSDIAFSPDSKCLASGCLVAPEIKIWKVPQLK